MLLFLNGIGTGELIIVLLFILIFFGADSIPGLARSFGRGIRQIKNATNDIQDEITKTSSEIKREMNANRALHDAQKTIENPVKEFTKELKNKGDEISQNIDKMGDTPQDSTYNPTKPKSENKPLDQL